MLAKMLQIYQTSNKDETNDKMKQVFNDFKNAQKFEFL